MNSELPTGLIGKAVKRKEDRRFLTGKGRYVDDIHRPGELWAVFVRSPHAHARVKGIDKDSALATHGRGRRIHGRRHGGGRLGFDPLSAGWSRTAMASHTRRCRTNALTPDKARYVGDHVAVVIAETASQARDAADLVDVDYEVLEANVDVTDAMQAAQMHDDAPHNLCYDWVLGDEGEIDAAFAKAHHIARLDLVNNRLIPSPMEPRAAIAEYDLASDGYTLWSTSQNPHMLRWMLSGAVTGIPETKIRVIAPDVGGGFGTKIYCYPEETACLWATRQVGRPVRWTADRVESFLADAHARDHFTRVELALDEKGQFLGLKVDTIASMGAYLSNYATSIPTYFYATLLAGTYRTPIIYCNVKAVFTNTSPVDALPRSGPTRSCLSSRTHRGHSGE